MDYYKNKWVLVTGAGRAGRIGADIVERLAKYGANTYVHYLSATKEAEKVKDAVLKAGSIHGVKVELIQGDFSKRSDVERVFSSISPDIVINNAAIFGNSKANLDMTLGEYLIEEENSLESHWQANMKASQLVTEAAIYKMTKDKKNGVIVYVGDAYIERGGAYPKGLAAYTLSKAFIPYIVRHYAAVYGKGGIRILGVLNGPIVPPPGTPDHVAAELQAEINMPKALLNPWVGTRNAAESIDHLIRMPNVNGSCIEIDGARIWTGSTEFD